MPAKTLTDRAVAAASSDLPDGKVPGLALRVGANSKSWTLTYRLRGGRAKHRVRLGRYPAIPLAKARALAQEVLAQAQQGIDPRFVRKQQDDAREMTVGVCIESYIETYAKKNHKRWENTRSQLIGYVAPDWEKLPIQSIDTRRVITLLELLADRPATRRAVYLTLSGFFEWCAGKHLVESNPVRAVARTARPQAVQSRDRVLSDAEIKLLWAACTKLGDRFGHFGVAVKLLLLTGQRRDQVLGLARSEVDFGRNEWVNPASRMKARTEHLVPLSDDAIRLLKSIPAHGDYFFTTNGEAPFSSVGKAKKKLGAACGIKDWRLHDLRRTSAVVLQRLGTPPYLVETIQGRVSGTFKGAAGVYQRYGYADEKRIALGKLSDEVHRIVGGRKAKVIQLRAAT